MITTLLRVVGVLVALGGLTAAWRGFEANDEIKGLEGNLSVEQADKAYRRSGEEGDRKIAAAEQAIEKKRTERNVWLGVGGVVFVAGLVLVLLPSSRKRNVPAAGPAPAPNQDAPAP